MKSVRFPLCAFLSLCYLVTATSARHPYAAGNGVKTSTTEPPATEPPATEPPATGIRCGGCNIEVFSGKKQPPCQEITVPGNETLTAPLDMALIGSCTSCAKGKVGEVNFFGCILENPQRLVQGDGWSILEDVNLNETSDAEQCHENKKSLIVCVTLCKGDRCNIIPPPQLDSKWYDDVRVLSGVIGGSVAVVAVALLVVILLLVLLIKKIVANNKKDKSAAADSADDEIVFK